VIAAAVGGVTAAPSSAKPSLTVSDVVVGETEGRATFKIRASKVVRRPIEIQYETGPSTSFAFAYPPGDFAARTGTKRIRVGERHSTVAVRVNDDTIDEWDETLELFLVKAKGARIKRNDPTGLGTIVDDDPEPVLSIHDAAVVEGDDGSTYAYFDLELSGRSGKEMSVGAFASLPGSADPWDDYASGTGLVLYPLPSSGFGGYSAVVYGDLEAEDDETFTARLAEPTNLTIGDGEAVGTIVDDDP
jgi:hypothetical protein